ncbi:MAG: carboxylating nicotinate-nucleotide diphosphorylase [Syntrophomonadaceae bacterium]|nr:carboxylating nicotinate-nucleotide diphosphorylase [Syntrophomonadaceae bacterium]
MEINEIWLEAVVAGALAEDLGSGDLTTSAIVPAGQQTRGIIYSKDRGVLAGLEVARRVFKRLDREIGFFPRLADGDRLEPGVEIAEVQGSARAILSGERVALNFLQRLSGIATLTARCAGRLNGSFTRIVDTRKTTPGLRALEKYAVRVGGGFNHRFGLYDMVLIKDNHIKLAGGIREAVERVRARVSPMVRIEVEVETLAQLEEALEAGVDIIMLDNMSQEQLRQSVERARGQVLLEASGGIREEDLPAVAGTGVDFISLGALTHSAPALDISLDLLAVKPR